ncbi:hypothetical protein HZS_6899 [Henneguya salminicola]|nr:hypothetical protein HZS_6899 [Henneguya salminicola]
MAYLYIILTEIDSPYIALRELVIISRDKLSFIISKLVEIVSESIDHLMVKSRDQIFWLIEQMIQLNINGVENIIIALIRQMAAKNLSPLNVYLTENILKLLNNNRDWLVQCQILSCVAVYVFLRQIEDHDFPDYHSLMLIEIDFCYNMLINHFDTCAMIGRELIRCLQIVGRHAQINSIWKLISENPSNLIPGVKDIWTILCRPTPRTIIISRIPYKIERQINYLAQNVLLGSHERYEKWFYQYHLSSPVFQSLIPDLIRYLCLTRYVNEGKGMPRWAIAAYLMSIIGDETINANCRLALFYDWFFTTITEPIISSIECGILLIINSIQFRPVLSGTLLEFLTLVSTNSIMHPLVSARDSISYSIKLSISKNIIPSFDSVIDCYGLSESFISRLREVFPDIFLSNTRRGPKDNDEFNPYFTHEQSNDIESIVENSNIISTNEINKKKRDISNQFYMPQIVEITQVPEYHCLPTPLKKLVRDLSFKISQMKRFEATDNIISKITTQTISFNAVANLAIVLSHAYAEDMSLPCISLYIQDQKTYSTPIFNILRSLRKNSDSYSQKILSLIKLWYKLDCRLGYHIIFFMIYETHESLENYAKLLNSMSCNPPAKFIMQDLTLCSHLDRKAFHKIILFAIDIFHKDFINNIDFLKSILKSIEPFELNSVLNKIRLKKLTFFSDFNNAHARGCGFACICQSVFLENIYKF